MVIPTNDATIVALGTQLEQSEKELIIYILHATPTFDHVIWLFTHVSRKANLELVRMHEVKRCKEEEGAMRLRGFIFLAIFSTVLLAVPLASGQTLTQRWGDPNME